MELDKSLRQACIELNSTAKSKAEILATIAKVAKRSPILADIDEDAVLGALTAREDIGSTGFEDGIAIPHCRLAGMNQFVAGLVTVPDGIDFGAIDDKPTTLFFFVIGPDDRNAYVRLLSNISRVAGQKEVRANLLTCESAATAYELLAGHPNAGQAVTQPIAFCSFQIVIQEEDRFFDILQSVSALTDGIDVIETRGAGHYLHSLPIFSTFWNNEEKQFHRIILGTIRRELVNELARGVNVACGGLDEGSGVMLSVQDCLFSQGSLEA